MKVLLIISLLFVGAEHPTSQAEVQPSLEECIAKAHKLMIEFDTQMSEKDKKDVIAYGAQCTVFLPKGDPA